MLTVLINNQALLFDFSEGQAHYRYCNSDKQAENMMFVFLCV